MISIAVAFKALRVLCIALEVADKVIDIVKKSGLIRKTQDVKELGAKVLQAKELGIEEPTDPSKYEEYLKKIDEINLDPQAMLKYSEAEKIEAGSKILVCALDSTYPDIQNLADFLEEVKNNPDFYTAKRMEQYLETGNKQKTDMSEVGQYLSGKFENDPNGMAKERRVRKLLKEAEEEMGEDGTKVIDAEIDRRVV